METEQYVPFVLLTYKIFCTAVKNIKVLWSLCEVPNIFVKLLTKFGVSWQIFVKVLNIKLHENLSTGSRADTCKQTARRKARHDVANR